MQADRLVIDYLRRLDAAAAILPPQRRAELTAEIREHIDLALHEAGATDEVTVRNVLERLGPPEDIVAAAVGQTMISGGSASESGRASKLTIAALVVLALGFLIPFFGWLAGVSLVLASGAWSSRDKIMGFLLGLSMAFLLTLPFAVLGIGIGASLGPLELLVLGWGFSGLVSAAYLAWRLRQTHSFVF